MKNDNSNNTTGRGLGLSIKPGNAVESSFDLHTHTDNRGTIQQREYEGSEFCTHGFDDKLLEVVGGIFVAFWTRVFGDETTQN